MEHQQPYVGIDLHRRRSVIVQRSHEAETLSATQAVNDDVVAFAKAVTDAGEHPEVIFRRILDIAPTGGVHPVTW